MLLAATVGLSWTAPSFDGGSAVIDYRLWSDTVSSSQVGLSWNEGSANGGSAVIDYTITYGVDTGHHNSISPEVPGPRL
jgi:hypothetical protein